MIIRLIKPEKRDKYVLSIYPQYHSIMFPDSILRTEKMDILTDVSYTNSIHKIYVCSMRDVNKLKYGDILIIYRTSPEPGQAEYKSVVTSICVVEEVREQNEFKDFNHFYKYASKYSVFDKRDLKYWYNKGGCTVIKMTYNIALTKKINRHKMIEELMFDRDIYWGFFKITDEQFQNILIGGEVNEGFIID
ncbi:EVE domain-containing protein [Ruminiclostridium josui]|uniref:EVE domain-containing protein n=1 Tax=Ruminiclostridium josui TaxID=1499 RepID=UPI001A9A359B|nr:EVE domain-containing protein [Ruminiclostridium josui]